MKPTIVYLLCTLLVLQGAWKPIAGLTIDSNVPTKEELVAKLMGGGVKVVDGSITTTCHADMSRTFTGGKNDIGIDSGILLTSGCAAQVGRNNLNDRYEKGLNGGYASQGSGTTSCSKGLSGDADLTALSGKPTRDACVLEFKFISESAYGSVYFKFVFGSEEYNDYVNSSFNDVFGFILDGENIAFITGTEQAVSINNVNHGYYARGNGANEDFFVNNAWMWNTTTSQAYTLGRNVEYDGLTTVLIAQKQGLAAGEHTIKLAVADAYDTAYDSGVFLEEGSFSSGITPTVSHIEPKEGGTGTRVTMYGAGFIPEYEYSCSFSGNEALRVWRVDDSKLVCEAAQYLLGETAAISLSYRMQGATSAFLSADYIDTAPKFLYNVGAEVTGTIFTEPDNLEESIRDTGGATIVITLNGVQWVADSKWDTDMKTSLMNAITATATQVGGWNKAVREYLTANNRVDTAVVRNSNTMVTITLPAIPTYSIDQDETIRVSIPSWCNNEGTVLSTDETFTLRSAATAKLGGSLVETLNNEDALADTDTIKELTITLHGTVWVGGTDSTRYIFDRTRSSIINGIESLQQESSGWNQLIRRAIRVDDVTRTSDTTVTVAVKGNSDYHVTANEELRVRVPQSAVEQSRTVEVESTSTIENTTTFWELFGTVIIACSVTFFSVTMAMIGCVFTVGCIHYKIVKAKKKREVLKSHQLAEDMARKHDAELHDADREINTVMNPIHGENVSPDNRHSRRSSRRVSQLEKGGPMYGVLDDDMPTPIRE